MIIAIALNYWSFWRIKSLKNLSSEFRLLTKKNQCLGQLTHLKQQLNSCALKQNYKHQSANTDQCHDCENFYYSSNSITLISLINLKSRLLILKKIHPPRIFPPSTFIDFLDLFHPPLVVYWIYVLVFSKKSHPPRLFQPPRLLER